MESKLPLLRKLVAQKWHEQGWNQPAYKELNDGDSGTFSPTPRASKTSLRTIFNSLALGALIAFCTVGIAWWPSRILRAAQIQSEAEYARGHAHGHAHGHRMDAAAVGFTSNDPQHLKQSYVSKPGTIQKLHPATPHQSSEEAMPYHCGSSIKEAKELGCSWDLLSAAWLRPECLDAELTESFRNEDDWPFFADKEGQHPLKEEELQWRVGEGMHYYTNLKYHRTHCSYQWRKMHRAMERGSRIENKLADYHHTLHCGYVFLQDGKLDELLTEISVEFMRC